MTTTDAPPGAGLDAVFAALADGTRRDIVARLTRGEATVTQLAAPYDMSVQAVSQHIRVLERCGLVSRGRYRQTRPCRLEPSSLSLVATWVDDSRRAWEERVDRLEAHVARTRDGGDR